MRAHELMNEATYPGAGSRFLTRVKSALGGKQSAGQVDVQKAFADRFKAFKTWLGQSGLEMGSSLTGAQIKNAWRTSPTLAAAMSEVGMTADDQPVSEKEVKDLLWTMLQLKYRGGAASATPTVPAATPAGSPAASGETPATPASAAAATTKQPSPAQIAKAGKAVADLMKFDAANQEKIVELLKQKISSTAINEDWKDSVAKVAGKIGGWVGSSTGAITGGGALFAKEIASAAKASYKAQQPPKYTPQTMAAFVKTLDPGVAKAMLDQYEQWQKMRATAKSEPDTTSAEISAATSTKPTEPTQQEKNQGLKNKLKNQRAAGTSLATSLRPLSPERLPKEESIEHSLRSRWKHYLSEA